MADSERDLERKLLSVAWGADFPVSVQRLAGDASTRVYFRAFYPRKGSAIIMVQPHPGTDGEAAFLEIQRFLESLELPVPRIYAHDEERGIAVLEDLGDDLLETVVERASDDKLRQMYGEAVSLLLRMRRATSKSSLPCRAFDLAFDEKKLMEEMHFFLTHFVKGLCRIEPTATAASTLEEFFLKICRLLAAQPRIFTHRDFHSRNLILRNNHLVMIDFQDARMGPAQYDLASLLRDSYVTLPETLVDELLTLYIDGVRETADNSSAKFRYIFDVMSLQRNIKALGTFGYQMSVRGSDRYASSVPRTAGYVSRNISLYPAFARFRSIVEELVILPSQQYSFISV